MSNNRLENTEEIDNKIDDIVEALESIKLGKLTILTGDNGTGKSVVRKQLAFYIQKLLPDRDLRNLVLGISMQGRTEARSEWGALSQLMHDPAEDPTSLSTYNLIWQLVGRFVEDDQTDNGTESAKGKTDNREKKSYLVIDEPEIGMSRESQLGIALYLKNNLEKILQNSLGLLIITHSETIVGELKDGAEFISLGNKYKSADEWIHRDIVPTDFEKLRKDSRELYLGILNRTKERKRRNE